MSQDLSPIAVHPTGEQSAVALGGAAPPPQPLVVDSFAGWLRVEWDHSTAFTPLGRLPFFIRLSEDCRSVRFVRRRLSAELREPECAQDPQRFGHGDVVDVGWTQALFSYRGVARRRGPARASRHEE